MKVKRFQRWKKVNIKEDFKYCSGFTEVKGDKNLPENAPREEWKIVIFEPAPRPGGSREATFSMGFMLPDGTAKVSNVKRKINDGPFAMRIGPGDCNFFIVSDETPVALQVWDCMSREEAEKEESLKEVVIY